MFHVSMAPNSIPINYLSADVGKGREKKNKKTKDYHH